MMNFFQFPQPNNDKNDHHFQTDLNGDELFDDGGDEFDQMLFQLGNDTNYREEQQEEQETDDDDDETLLTNTTTTTTTTEDDDIDFMRLPNCQAKEISETPCPELTESLIAKQMAGLSMKDREEVYFDIHGVSGVVDEEAEPGFLDRKLQEMANELAKIDAAEKCAYLLAQQLNPAFVASRDLQLRFLRSDRFDAPAAAQRYVNHYQFKLQLFGAEKLATSITQQDLGTEGMDALYTGYNQLLPQRDNAGRAVWLYVAGTKQHQYTEQALSRRFFYNSMMMTDDVETQRKGVVAIVYAMNQGGPRRGSKGINAVWKFGTYFRSLPIRIASLHYCYNKYAWLPMMSILQLTSDVFLRLRFRAHRGSHTECMYNLQTFGIPVGSIPIRQDGQVVSEGYRQFLQKRYLQEQQWKAAMSQQQQQTQPAAVPSNNNNNNVGSATGSIHPNHHNQNQNHNNINNTMMMISNRISVPSRSDVLLGRGKGYFGHVGNIRYRSLIEDLRDRYDKASKEDKHQISQEVVQLVLQSGGRFLKDDGAGWVVVEEEVARLKVSHSFRAARKQSTSTTTKKTSSSSSERPAAVKSTSASRDLERREVVPVKRPRAV